MKLQQRGDREPSAVSAVTDIERGGLSQPQRTWAVIAIWLAIGVATLDNSVVALALPTLGRSFGTSAAATIWVVNSYQVAIAMVLLPLASLSDIVGHRRMYLAGLALFTIASILCGVAPDLTELTVARFAQGLGAAAIMGVNSALIRSIYPATKLGRAVGYNALVVALCSAVGPSLAGFILAHASWRWIFLINLPIGCLAIVISALALPPGSTTSRRFDRPAAVLSAVAFGAFFFGMTELAQGSQSLPATGFLGVAAAAGWILVRLARGKKAPLMPLDLISVATLRLSYLASVSAFAAMSLVLIASPFYLQHLGFDAATVGLLISPLPVAMVVCAPIAGRLVDRYTAGALGGIGMALFVAGAVVIAVVPRSLLLPGFVLGMTACGFGFGLFQTPNNRTMIVAAPVSRMGAAAGMQSMSRTIGQLTGAVITAGTLYLFGTGTQQTALLAAALAAIAGFCSIRRLKAPTA